MLTTQADATLNVSSVPPDAIAPLAPVDGSTGVAVTPTFTWSAVAGATSYDIQVATDPAFGSIVASATGLTGASFTPGAALTDNTVYYWHVQAINGCGTEGYTPVSAFQTAGIATASFCRSPDIALPDGNTTGVSDSQIVTTTGALLDLDVSVQATHTWVGDLVFAVQNVDTGTSATVIDQPGVPASTYGCSYNHVNATLDDRAAVPVENQCATSAGANPPPYAIEGTFTPNNALSAFNGQPLADTWRLTASDRVTGDTGTLTQWCLIATYSVALAADYSDSASSYGVAWHTGNGVLRLGATWSADTTFAAGSDGSTDDGVTFVGPFQAGQPATVRVSVQGAPLADYTLRLWFDWDGDGAFSPSEQVYSSTVTNGDTDLVVSVPASAVGSVPYRARLYDVAFAAAASPVSDSSSYGGATGGEVEDGLTPCVAAAPVTGITISEPGTDQVQLAWTAPAGAAQYQVWRALNEPYFSPGADCTAPGAYTCSETAGTSFAETLTADNPTYIVRAVSTCGGYSNAAYHRVGRFSFDLIPGD